MRISIASLSVAACLVAGAACSGVNVPIYGEDGGDVERRDDDAGRDAGTRGDATAKSDASRDSSTKSDAPDKVDAAEGCPPATVPATICGLPCTTPGLQCLTNIGALYCNREPNGELIWLCVAGGPL